MGPNGTGKSSIVMAIAVGLGAAPRQLGRADTLSEFILTGERRGCDGVRVARRRSHGTNPNDRAKDNTSSQSGTSKWKIDGKSATEPQVKELVEKDLKIQIGNLCTFLPQEKVGEFSAFDDIGLLRETEKALGGQDLVDKHEALIKAEKAASEGARRMRTAAEELEDCEKRLKAELEQRTQASGSAWVENTSEAAARVSATPRHRDASTWVRQCVREQRLARYLWVKFEEKRELALAAKEAKKTAVEKVKEADEAAQPLREERDRAERARQQAKQKYDAKQRQTADAFAHLERDKKDLEKRLEDSRARKTPRKTPSKERRRRRPTPRSCGRPRTRRNALSKPSGRSTSLG